MRPLDEQKIITGTGVGGPFDTVTAYELHNEILSGIWVTSYSGFVQAIPKILDPAPPPVMGGYRWIENSGQWEQREGHFITSALIYFGFDGKGNVSGYAEHNRGDTDQHKKFSITGTYEAFNSVEEPQLYWGTIYTTRLSGQPSNYYFVRKNMRELEWLSIPPAQVDLNPDPDNPRRPIIARGTFTKVQGVSWWRQIVHWFD